MKAASCGAKRDKSGRENLACCHAGAISRAAGEIIALALKRKEKTAAQQQQRKPESSPRSATNAMVEFLLPSSPATLSFLNIPLSRRRRPTPRMPRRHSTGRHGRHAWPISPVQMYSNKVRCCQHGSGHAESQLHNRPIRNHTYTKSSLRKRTICKSSIEIDTIDAIEKHRSVSFIAFFFHFHRS